MKRTVNKTSNEIPGWFRLFLASLCLAAFVGAARFVSTTCDVGEEADEAEFSSEKPSGYLSSSFAFDDCSTYLDGRGRRFGKDVSVDSAMVAASYDGSEGIFEVPVTSKEDELAALEQPAEFVDDLDEEIAADLPELQDSFVEPDPNAPTFDEFASSELSPPGWKEDELDCEVQDLSGEWKEFDEGKNGDLALDGADFVDQFDNSLVTDDFFRTNATTAFIGQTNAAPEDATSAKEKKSGISQVSGVTPVQPRRAGRYVSQGAVGGSGEVVIQIQ